MIGYKKSSLERERVSEVKSGRGSAFFKNTVYNMWSDFRIVLFKTLSSTVNNIIKRLWSLNQY